MNIGHGLSLAYFALSGILCVTAIALLVKPRLRLGRFIFTSVVTRGIGVGLLLLAAWSYYAGNIWWTLASV